MSKSLLRLFNAVQVIDKNRVGSFDPSVLARTIKNGYVIHPSIVVTPSLLAEVESVVGLSGEKANAAFHKSWSVVRDASIEQLVLQQMIHYITTYGFESMGIFDNDTVYVPSEVLDVPGVDGVKLTVVRAMTSEEILEAIVKLGSGIALGQKTLDDIMEVVKDNQFNSDFIGQIKNRELKIRLYDTYNLAPQDVEEYFRYVIFKITGETLIINNDNLIKKIRAADSKTLDRLLQKAPASLPSIFLRYRKLFLAMKYASKNKTFFNQMRKQASWMHVPLGVDYLNDVTNQIKNNTLNIDRLRRKLVDAPVFRKIRLAYALSSRVNPADSIIYKVRNGKGWVTDFEWNDKSMRMAQIALDVVVQSIADGISKNVAGKTFYIPEGVHYAMPATEKMFTGNIPTNSFVEVPEDMIFGVHWYDGSDDGYGGRVDLDLAMISVMGKIGWDGAYRTRDRDILFSGDMTSARRPQGATELFYTKAGLQFPNILYVNYFNFNADSPVETKLFVAHETPKVFGRNYMVDPNNIVAMANLQVDKKSTVLGLAMAVNGKNRFYFSNTSISKAITSSKGNISMQAKDYMVNSCLSIIELSEVLDLAGAYVVKEKPENIVFTDLSPEALDKTTIINLFQ